MPRRLRFIPEGGSVVEVECRTHQGKSLLEPSAAGRDLVWGVLGRAQRLYNVELFGICFLSNHFHLLLRVQDAAQLAAFMRFVDGQLARKFNRLLGRSNAFWGSRYACSLVSNEPEAQLSRFLYLLRQGVKEGLVACPLEWPGASSLRALLDLQTLQGTWIDETSLGKAQRSGQRVQPMDFAQHEQVRLSLLPAWSGLPEATRNQYLQELLDLVRHEGKQRQLQTGKPPLGAQRLRLSDQPRPKPRGRGPLPLVHAATRAVRNLYRAAYRAFELAFRQAAQALQRGLPGPPFPPGSFPPRGPFIPPRSAPA